MFITRNSPNTEKDLLNALAGYEEEAQQVLKESPILSDLDLDSDEGQAALVERVKDKFDSPEWLAVAVEVLTDKVREKLEEEDALSAAWAMGKLQEIHSLLVYARALEPLIWRGYNSFAVDAMDAIFSIWDTESQNSSEEFWQQTFSQNMIILSQVLHAPAVLYQGQAYIGGKTVQGKHGREVDFLLKNEVFGGAVIVEIKTPTTKLLGGRYRGICKPSSELSGAVTQLLDYRDILSRDYYRLRSQDPDWEAVDPPCVLLIGNSEELADSTKNRSFELYRRNLKSVEVMTFDELFAKVAHFLNAVSVTGLGRAD